MTNIYNVEGRLTLDCWLWDKSESKLVTFFNGSNFYKKMEAEEKWEEEMVFMVMMKVSQKKTVLIVVVDEDDDDINYQCAAPLVSTEVP